MSDSKSDVPAWLVQAMKVELSNTDLQKLLPGHDQILTSAQLSLAPRLPFDSKGRLIILWLQKDSEGHWTCAFRAPGGKIEYFDPYGYPPGAADDYISPEEDARLHNITPAGMVRLLDATGDWFMNKHDYQSKVSTVATCGRWVAARLMNQNKTEDEFHTWIDELAGSLPLDAAVTLFTERALKRIPTT